MPLPPTPFNPTGNFFLEVPTTLSATALGRLRWLDLRAVCVEGDAAATKHYWSTAKCATRQNVAALARTLRRKNRHVTVLHDTS